MTAYRHYDINNTISTRCLRQTNFRENLGCILVQINMIPGEGVSSPLTSSMAVACVVMLR